jgi:regulation of enolase protein 1 (concanavalin A-like superfamily)
MLGAREGPNTAIGALAPKAALDRRVFLDSTLALAGLASLWPHTPLLAGGQTVANAGLLSRMQWLNEPPSWHVEGDTLRVTSAAKADFYRLPGWNVDNGNFLHLPVPGDFTFEARVSGQFAARYDQAGLMVRLDAENWVKCGTEFVDGQRYASVVFTRGYSDWSTMKDLSDTAPVWWRVVRRKEAIETLCSLDGRHFISVRQGYFISAPQVEVGLLCASLEGQGVKARFDSLRLTGL